MAVYPKADKWFVKFDHKGKTIRQFGFKDEANAEAWELLARSHLKLGKPLPAVEDAGRKVGGRDAALLKGVLRSAEVLHWNKLRKGGGKQVLNARAFVNWVGPDATAEEAFTKKTINGYLEYLSNTRGVANPTMNRHISAISVLQKHADVKPVKLPWFKPDYSRARKRFFSPEEERDIIALLTRWGRERERDLFIFLNDTGLRPWEEALPLTWKQCKSAGWVKDIIGKSGNLRDVPLTTRAQLALGRQAGGGSGPWEGLNKYTLNDLWQRLRAAIPTLDGESAALRTVWYTCRHTFASRMVQAGEPYGHIAKLMDNSVQMIEKVYGHLAPDHLKGAVASLEIYGQGTPLSLVKNT